MSENELIGETGGPVFTVLLIVLYHLIGKIGRHSERDGAHTKQVNERDQDRPTHNPKKLSGKDDTWLLWSPNVGGQSVHIREGPPEPRENKRLMAAVREPGQSQ